MTRYRIRNNNIKIPFTKKEEKTQDALEAANPPLTPKQFKEQKITKMKTKVALRYSNNVDRYYFKRARLKAEGENYEVPEKIKTYATALKTVSDKMEMDVNALSLIDDMRDYKINWPDNPKE